jgi:hypothetical protein
MHGSTSIGRLLRLGALALSLAAAVAFTPSCKQGENERCQIDSDCAEDYYCYYGSGTDKIIGGTCRSKTANTPPPQDLATPADLTPPPDLAPADM